MISLVFFKYFFVSGCTASNIVFWNAMSGLHRFDEGLFFQKCICPFCDWIVLNFLAVSLGFPCVGDVLIEFNMNCQIQYTSCNFQRLWSWVHVFPSSCHRSSWLHLVSKESLDIEKGLEHPRLYYPERFAPWKKHFWNPHFGKYSLKSPRSTFAKSFGSMTSTRLQQAEHFFPVP